MSFRTFILLFCLLVPPFVTTAGAQTTATISGTVHDANGGALPGVLVTATNTDTRLVRTSVTGAEGRYVIAALPPGNYELRAELAGFKPHVRRDLALTISETLALNLTLQLGDLEIEDVVVGVSPLVNTASSELSYLVGTNTIEQLPLNGRNYTDLALLQPGVLAFPHRDGGSVVAHGLGISVNGQDPRSNVYLLDGTLQNDFTNGPAGSAAGTALGMDTIREFRVQANAYNAEFGRNSGGQINVLTKSGTNQLSGSAFEYHRNDAMDARNFFDVGEKPDFRRNQFGGTVGGPISTDRAFFFVGYEALIERLGRTISTVVPDDNARLGILPSGVVGVNPAVAPYLSEFPRANGPLLGQGLAVYNFPFSQRLDEHFGQGRLDYNFSPNRQVFARYTLDDTNQFLPTDYPQFPREFLSRNQFFTSEYRQVFSANTLATARLGFSRTRIGQNVEANTSQPLGEFVPGRGIMGDIDIGGLRRFGPQSSANLRLVQNVFSFQNDWVHTNGRHLIKAGGLVEHYQDNMVNPTFSLGIYAFPNLSAFLRNTPNNFIGLTPEAQFDRYWRFTLFGFYVQDDFQITPRLTLNGGLRYEFATLPADKYGRDVAMPDLTAPTETIGPLYQNPTYTNLSPRGGFAWDIFGDGSTALRGGYGLYFNTNNHQNLIVTVTNPPFTPRPVIVNPTFPNPPFDRAGAISIRPIQYRSRQPAAARLQREPAAGNLVAHGGHRRLCRVERPPSASQQRREHGAAGVSGRRHAVHPRGHAAAEPQLLDNRVEEQRRRVLVQRPDPRRQAPLEQRGCVPDVVHVLQERRHDAGVDVLLRRHQRHDVGDAGVHPRLQQGTLGLRRAPQPRAELHVGAAVREQPVRRRSGNPRRVEPLRHLDGPQRPAADGVRDVEPFTIAMEPVARPGDRPGPPELCAWIRSGQRGARPRRSVVQSRRLRAAARGHLRKHGTWRFHRPRPADARPVALEADAVRRARQPGPPRVPHRSVQHPESRQLRRPRAARLRRTGGQRGNARDFRSYFEYGDVIPADSTRAAHDFLDRASARPPERSGAIGPPRATAMGGPAGRSPPVE